jgi:photosystem II stability/assembly factor-like uncharacterized protein
MVVFIIIPFSELCAQWIKTSAPYNVYYCFAVSEANLFTGTNYGGVFLSTNRGTSWIAINSGLTSLHVYSLAVSDTNIFAGTGDFIVSGHGVFLSTNNGTIWNMVNSGLPTNDWIKAFATSGKELFAGTSDRGVFLSTNNGTSWNAVNTGLSYLEIMGLGVFDTNLFAGTRDLATGAACVFLSTNNGVIWTPINNGLPESAYAYTFAAYGKDIFIGTYNGVFISTNNGTSWTAVNNGLNDSYRVFALIVNGGNLIAGSDGGVFISTNSGASWISFNNRFPQNGIGLPDVGIRALAVVGTDLFAATNEGVWKRSLSDITPVEGLSVDLPKQFQLEQNYPNPFNPMTTISFKLPSRSLVTLKVFDLIGREVITIVSEELSAGNYSRQWNASNMASGIYFYRLQASSFFETKKLVLLR